MLLAILLSVVSSQTPPIWPDKFSVNFTELNDDIGIKARTQGTLYYDWPNKQYRLDRDNGVGDRYCGSVNLFRNTPCQHIVKNEKRYLYFPNLSSCCYCCNSTAGCGVLEPNWAADATYVGNEIDHNGNSAEKFEKSGAQKNYIYSLKGTTINSQIDQEPNNFIYFLVNTYKYQVDASIFNLPKECASPKNCGGLVCSNLRGEI